MKNSHRLAVSVLVASAVTLGLLAACGGASSGGSQAAAPPPPQEPSPTVTVQRGLTVCSVDGQSLQADWVAPPAAVSRRRAVLFVHGGGWSAGSRADYEPLALSLATQGYTGLLVDYRLAPSVQHPQQVQDLSCALRWLRQNAVRMGVDAERVGVVGGSAGAHLAGWLAYGRDDASLDGPGHPLGPRARVVLAVLHAGPHDFSVMDSLSPEAQGTVFALLGTRQPSPTQLAQASTIALVSATSPPTLILHGERDPLVPVDQAHRLDRALSAAGVPHRLLVIPGAAHGDFGRDPDAVGRVVLEFLAGL